VVNEESTVILAVITIVLQLRLDLLSLQAAFTLSTSIIGVKIVRLLGLQAGRRTLELWRHLFGLGLLSFTVAMLLLLLLLYIVDIIL